MTGSNRNLNTLPGLLLAWYEAHARVLPWRIGPAERALGVVADPYRVWLSEIMLQQTTVPHAMRYFHAFTKRWPSVEALAAARDVDVMAAWAGLGYYARARNLLACARQVVVLGKFPEDVHALRKLPGIGPYTAGAIAAIAFGARAAAVDGNVERVFARLLALKGDWKVEKKRIGVAVQTLVPVERSGEFAEALMDLGAGICSPKRPDCGVCPLTTLCKAQTEGVPENYPVKPARALRPIRYGAAFILLHGGEILLEQRPAKGLLGGMLGLPGTDWTEGAMPAADYPHAADWREAGHIRHVFTHFTLELDLWRGELHMARPDGLWIKHTEMTGLPSVFAKALAAADL